jgi:hypothetical protein
MMSSHIMDQGSKITFDIEEKQINLGEKLVFQEFTELHQEMQICEKESLKSILG